MEVTSATNLADIFIQPCQVKSVGHSELSAVYALQKAEGVKKKFN